MCRMQLQMDWDNLSFIIHKNIRKPPFTRDKFGQKNWWFVSRNSSNNYSSHIHAKKRQTIYVCENVLGYIEFRHKKHKLQYFTSISWNWVQLSLGLGVFFTIDDKFYSCRDWTQTRHLMAIAVNAFRNIFKTRSRTVNHQA